MDYYDQDTIIFLNGAFVKATEASGDLYSQTLHYGNGVFEGIRSYETADGARILKASEHFERLIFSAGVMGLEVGFSVEEMIDIAYRLLEKNNLRDAYIRPLVVADPMMGLGPAPHASLVMMAWKWGRLLGDKLVKLSVSSWRRPHPKSCVVEAKVSGHYVNSILASTEARKKGYDDAVMLDTEGFVAECSGANIFMEKDHILYTPALGNILPGITRLTVMNLAREMQIPVVEKQLTLDELKSADSMFITGTAAEVTGVASLDGHTFPMEWDFTFGYSLARKYRLLALHADAQPTTVI